MTVPFSLRLLALVTISLVSCGKSDDATPASITGEWSINSAESGSFFADGRNGYTQSTANHTGDGVKINFSDDGHFHFDNNLAPSSGTYVYNSKDSSLTINPDSCDFINYCYFGQGFQFSLAVYPATVSPVKPALVHTPGILYVGYRSKDSMQLFAGYVQPNSSLGDSIIIVRNGLRKW